MISLEIVAARLEGLEETIIARLLDRAQFARNPIAYEAGRSGFSGAGDLSLFELRLRAHEEMDVQFGRFCVPEERPFCAGLTKSRREVHLPDTGLNLKDFDLISQTATLKPAYLNFLDALCPTGDDGQYGSSVEHDVHCLQAISRRIHYGALYVAESKYLASPALYQDLVKNGQKDKVIASLTRAEVEEAILKRVKTKVDQLQAAANPKIRTIIHPEIVVDFYKSTIIPLTKEGEWLYLRHRQ
jgi:chorismate mutase